MRNIFFVVCLIVVITAVAGCGGGGAGGAGGTTTGSTAVLVGNVTSPVGAALAGATVVVTPSSGGGAFSSVTALNGSFRIPSIPTGPSIVTITCPGYDPRYKTVTFAAGDNSIGACQLRVNSGPDTDVPKISVTVNGLTTYYTENLSLTDSGQFVIKAANPDPTKDDLIHIQLAGVPVAETGYNLYRNTLGSLGYATILVNDSACESVSGTITIGTLGDKTIGRYWRGYFNFMASIGGVNKTVTGSFAIPDP